MNARNGGGVGMPVPVRARMSAPACGRMSAARGAGGGGLARGGRALCALVLAGALFGSLVACGRSGAGGPEVTLALSTQTNPFFVQVREGARERAGELGIPLNVQDAGDDALAQANQLDNAVATGAGAVIVNPVDSDAVAPSVEAVNRAGIPLVAVDRGSSAGRLDSFVASDNRAGGAQAADALAEAIGGEGEIIVLQGVAGTSASRDRGAGFRERMARYPGITIVAEQTANFDRTEGLDVATNLLQAHPGVVGIFAENDEMALGAVEAVGSRAGSDVAIVGFDGTLEGLQAVAAGLLTATVAQQPEELGRVAVDQAVGIIRGRDVPGTVPVGVVTVDGRNVREHLG